MHGLRVLDQAAKDELAKRKLLVQASAETERDMRHLAVITRLSFPALVDLWCKLKVIRPLASESAVTETTYRLAKSNQFEANDIWMRWGLQARLEAPRLQASEFD